MGGGGEAGPREQFPGISQHFTEVLLGKAAAVNNDDCGRWRAGVSAPMRAEREAETSEKDAAERARRLAALKHGLHFRGWKMRHQEGCGERRSGWLGGRQPRHVCCELSTGYRGKEMRVQPLMSPGLGGRRSQRNKQKITKQSDQDGGCRAHGNPEEAQLKQRRANCSQPRLRIKIT